MLFTIWVSSYKEVGVTLPIVDSLRTDVPVQTRGQERFEVRICLYLSNIYNIYNNYYVLTSSHIIAERVVQRFSLIEGWC